MISINCTVPFASGIQRVRIFPEALDNYAKLGTLKLEVVHSKLDSPGTACDGVSVIHHMRSRMWVHLVPVLQSRGVDPTTV